MIRILKNILHLIFIFIVVWIITVSFLWMSGYRLPFLENEDAKAGKDGSGGMAVVSGDAVSVKECGFSGGAAVLIGNEGSGLTAETSEKCSERITIKMHGTAESLNAAAAASILMWELMNG